MKAVFHSKQRVIRQLATWFLFVVLFLLPNFVLAQSPTPTIGPTPTPTGAPTPTPSMAVPTLSSVGYAVMFGLLALFSIWFILRRKEES